MIPAEFFIFVKAKSDQIKFEQEAEQILTARICATIANFVPMRTKKGKSFKEEDFMPKKTRKKTEQEMLKEVMRLNALFGGTVIRKRGGSNER